VYARFDIEATDGVCAPGSPSVAPDSLCSDGVPWMLATIGEFQIVGAFDVCEMVPQYDVGRERHGAIRGARDSHVIGYRMLDSRQAIPRQALDVVFR
jgi:arginase family enzyme